MEEDRPIKIYGETELESEYRDWFDEQCEVHGPEWHKNPRDTPLEPPFRPLKDVPVPVEKEERTLIKLTHPHWGVVDGRMMWIVPSEWPDKEAPSLVNPSKVYLEE